MSAKILFLDIDGVLNTPKSLRLGIFVETNLLHELEKIIAETEAKIVISSSWGEAGIDLLREHGFAHMSSIIGVTPRERRWRGEQILHWLEKNGMENADYVVIEDEIFDVCGPKCDVIPQWRVVACNPYEGLRGKAEEAIAILNKETT